MTAGACRSAAASLLLVLVALSSCDRSSSRPDGSGPAPDISLLSDSAPVPDIWTGEPWLDLGPHRDLGLTDTARPDVPLDIGPNRSLDQLADLSPDAQPDLMGCYVPPDQKAPLDKGAGINDLNPSDATPKQKGFLLTADNASGTALAVDKVGNIYVAGHAHKQINIGGKLIGLNGKWTEFVVKLDPNGKAIWSQHAVVLKGSTAYINGLAVDSKGNIYLAGSFSGQLVVGNTTLTTLKSKYHNWDVLIAKLSPKGAWLWAETVGVGPISPSFSSIEEARSIAVDPFDNILVAGTAGKGALFGSFVHPGGTFVAKLHSSGKYLWLATTKGGPFVRRNSLKVDGKGSSYISGIFGGNVSFGKHALFTPSIQSKAAFVAKLDCKGKFLWATSAPGTHASGNALDKAGNLYIQPKPAQFLKVSASGKILNTSKSCIEPGKTGSNTRSVAISAQGDVYLHGDFSYQLKCGNKYYIANSYGKDVYILKLSAPGQFKWMERIRGPGNPDSFMIIRKNVVLVAGDYRGETYFGSIKVTGKKNLASFYLWRFNMP